AIMLATTIVRKDGEHIEVTAQFHRFFQTLQSCYRQTRIPQTLQIMQ
ncbi:hypothetical protein CCACVL1_25017, partial [Corchorus capsularis]